MDARKIREMLNGRAEDVCRHLLPGGKLVNGEWVIGDAKGTEGNSLKVFVQGPRAGFWHDFNPPAGQRQGGDLFHLWEEARGCNFKQAIEEAKKFLGVRDEREDWRRAGEGKSDRITGLTGKEFEIHPVTQCYPLIMTEREWVTFLYYLRGYTPPEQLFVGATIKI